MREWLTKDDMFHLANVGPEVEEYYTDEPAMVWEPISDEELYQVLREELEGDNYARDFYGIRPE